jgi:hypothetical protein
MSQFSDLGLRQAQQHRLGYYTYKCEWLYTQSLDKCKQRRTQLRKAYECIFRPNLVRHSNTVSPSVSVAVPDEGPSPVQKCTLRMTF